MSQTIGLIAATLTGNHGAEAMVSTVVGRLRDRNPNARFVLFSYYPRADRQVLDAAHVEIADSTPLRLVLAHLPGALLAACMPRRWRRGSRLLPAEVRQLSQCSVLVDVSGVSFMDGREKFLPFNILANLPAMLLGVPVVKAAQALGPFEGIINRLAARAILPRCASIVARGETTKRHLVSLGLGNVLGAPDVAFLMEDRDRLVKVAGGYVEATIDEIARRRGEGARVVGVCPSSVVYAKAGEAYLEALASLVSRIEAAGHAVVLFPNATRGQGVKRMRNNDIPVIHLLAKRLAGTGNQSNAIVVDRDVDAVSIKHIISACDTLIVSRFHAMIAALLEGRATVVFGWSHKYLEIMAFFGLEELVFDYANMASDELYPKVAAVIERSESVGEQIATTLPQVQAAALRQIDAIEAVLRSDLRADAA